MKNQNSIKLVKILYKALDESESFKEYKKRVKQLIADETFSLE